MSLFYLYEVLLLDTIFIFPEYFSPPIIMNDYFWGVIVEKRSNLKKSIFSYGIIQNMQNLLGRMTKIGRILKTADLRMKYISSVFCFLVLYDLLISACTLNIKKYFSFDMIYFPVTGKSISRTELEIKTTFGSSF